MREIKFRAWHTKKNCWLPDWLYRMLSGGPLVESSEYETDSGEWVFSAEDEAAEGEYILEQFTGLRDKNGREIYEGDIVNIVQRPCWYKGYEKTVVKWDEIGFYPWTDVSSEIDRDYLASRLPEDIEVIGNIHENPELLNG